MVDCVGKFRNWDRRVVSLLYLPVDGCLLALTVTSDHMASAVFIEGFSSVEPVIWLAWLGVESNRLIFTFRSWIAFG